jgi:plastocyanin
VLSVPRVLFAVPLLALGAFLPAATRAPTSAPAGAIGMEHEEFSVDTVTIPVGGRVTFVNDSRWLHVLGPGDHGRLTADAGVPAMGPRGALMSQTGDVYTTATWNTPGTYKVTCSLHPEMTVTVVVRG